MHLYSIFTDSADKSRCFILSLYFSSSFVPLISISELLFSPPAPKQLMQHYQVSYLWMREKNLRREPALVLSICFCRIENKKPSWSTSIELWFPLWEFTALAFGFVLIWRRSTHTHKLLGAKVGWLWRIADSSTYLSSVLFSSNHAIITHSLV